MLQWQFTSTGNRKHLTENTTKYKFFNYNNNAHKKRKMGINQVLSKIAKINEVTELASHQIELKTMDEFNRSVFGDDTWVTELTDYINKSIDLKKQLQSRIDGGLFVGQEAVKSINKTLAMEAPLEKAIVDFGIPEPAEFKKNKEKIRKTQTQVNDLIKKLKTL